MRRTSFWVAMSITLIDAPAEFKTKTMPFAQTGEVQPMAAIARNNKKVRRRMANNAPADWRRSLTHKPRIGQGYSRLFRGLPRANTAVTKANITQAGVEISTLSVEAWPAYARN